MHDSIQLTIPVSMLSIYACVDMHTHILKQGERLLKLIGVYKTSSTWGFTLEFFMF